MVETEDWPADSAICDLTAGGTFGGNNNKTQKYVVQWYCEIVF